MRAGRELRGAALILATIHVGAAAPVLAECSHLNDPLQVLDFRFDMDPSDWDFVLHDVNFDDAGNQNTEKPAMFSCGDEAPVPARVRRKKLAALPSDANPVKVSLKIDFDDDVPDGEWHSHRKISLENGAGGVLVTEGLAWQLLARAGVIASGSAWVRLSVNGKPIGIYTRVEQVDKRFLRRHLGEDEGFLFKATRQVTREGETDPHAAKLCYWPFGDKCPIPPSYATLPQDCDVHQLLALAAVNAYMVNWDSLFGLGNNYWWYSSTRPRLYFPWDLDVAMTADPRTDPRRDPHDLVPGASGFEVLLNDAGLRAHFDSELLRLVRDTFQIDVLDRILDEITAAVGPAIRSDPLNGLAGGFDAEVKRLRGWLRTRNESVKGFLPSSEPPAIVINEVLASNGSINADEHGEYADWVELYNRGSAAAPLANLYLSDDPASPRKWPLPGGEMAPGSHQLVWCDHDADQGPFHTGFQLNADGDAVGLYEVEGNAHRAVDFVLLGPEARDVSLGRFPDGSPGFRRLSCPTPAAANRESCDELGKRFVRGDANDDGALNITDAVNVLLGLFASESLGCRRAADANDDGAIDITDAVVILQHLFQGGPAPAAPFPRCGWDTTADALECEDSGRCE